MPEPVAFISHFRIKEGKLDAYLELQRDVARQLEAEKPRTLVFLIYVDEDGTEMSALHVFADPEAMDLHFAGSSERGAAAYEFLEPKGWEIYGTPSQQAQETLQQAAQSAGASLTVQSRYTDGFLRAQADDTRGAS